MSEDRWWRKYGHLSTMAGRLGALSDDGACILRDSTSDDCYLTLRYGLRRSATYYFRHTVTTDEVEELERDIRDLHERRLQFQAKWGSR